MAAKKSGFLEGFKGFVKRGNVIDLAVAVVVGAAFSGITKSLVDDIINPLLGLLIGKVDFSNMFVVIRESAATPGPYKTVAEAQAAGAVTINYGSFINVCINFVIVAFAMFMVIRSVQRLNTAGEPESTPAKPDPRRCPYCRTEVADAATRCPACTSELELEESV